MIYRKRILKNAVVTTDIEGNVGLVDGSDGKDKIHDLFGPFKDKYVNVIVEEV